MGFEVRSTLRLKSLYIAAVEIKKNVDPRMVP